MDVALLGAETLRTRTYFDAMRAADILPARIVLMRRSESSATHDIERASTAAGTALEIVEADDVNSPSVVRAVAALPQKYVVFSGPSGGIAKEPLFQTGKRFIHVHPGRLPDFRGSTTIYYSLLAERRVEATAFFLEETIDTGPILGRATFDPPIDRMTIDREYDVKIRAELLVSILQSYARRGSFVESLQPRTGGETYFIIHPVLKHIAILSQ